MVKKSKFLISLEDLDVEKFCASIEGLVSDIGFSDVEAEYMDVVNALKATSEFMSRQGGKILLILGNDSNYSPKPASNDKTNRKFFFANESSFGKLAADMHKYLTSTSLYVFGRKKPKNLASIGELIRLSGGDVHYYDDSTSSDCFLISGSILQ